MIIPYTKQITWKPVRNLNFFPRTKGNKLAVNSSEQLAVALVSYLGKISYSLMSLFMYYGKYFVR